VILPPLPFRFAGALSGQAFADEDGDGWLRRGESGVSGVTINLTGPTSASAVTDAQGRFSLPNLPNGSYTVTVTPPAGYAAVPPQTITLNNGGALSWRCGRWANSPARCMRIGMGTAVAGPTNR
jgi:hypothetical protein